MPDGPIPGGTERERRKRVLVCFQLLEADDIGSFALQPIKQIAEARANAIDVEGGNFHINRDSSRKKPYSPLRRKAPPIIRRFSSIETRNLPLQRCPYLVQLGNLANLETKRFAAFQALREILTSWFQRFQTFYKRR